MKTLFAARVVGPTGSQLTLSAVAPLFRATMELTVESRVNAVRKMYTPGPFKVRVPVILMAPA